MGVSKVVYGDTTIMDITDTTATPSTMAEGVTAYGADGEKMTGTMTTTSTTELYYVTPEQFGAVGDGVTDDTAAWQAMLDSGCQRVVCGKDKTYYFAQTLLTITQTANTMFEIDLNGSRLVDCTIAHNMNNDLTDWNHSYSADMLNIKNGFIGTNNATRNAYKPVFLLSGGWIQLQNLQFVRTPYVLALPQRYIDNLEISNCVMHLYNATTDDFSAGLDAINSIGSDGSISKLSDNTMLSGDHWKFTACNEFHTAVVDDYKFGLFARHQSIIFEQCIQTHVAIGTQVTAIFHGCHYESENTFILAGNLNGTKILFDSCTFLYNNFEIIDHVGVTYLNCLFDVGDYGRCDSTRVFTKSLTRYRCEFIRCSAGITSNHILDSSMLRHLYMSPLYNTISDYYKTWCSDMFNTITVGVITDSAGYNGFTETGSYVFDVFLHLNNNVREYYKHIQLSYNKTDVTAQYFNIGNNKIYFPNYLLEIYVTTPSSTIYKYFVRKYPLMSNSNNWTEINNEETAIIRVAKGWSYILTQNDADYSNITSHIDMSTVVSAVPTNYTQSDAITTF